MPKQLPRVRFAEAPKGGNEPYSGCVRVELDLEVFGENLDADLEVPDRPIRLSELVPGARDIADRIVDLTIRSWFGPGNAPPCRRGCVRCCYYLVPVCVPEALRLMEEFAALPARRRQRLDRSFLAAGSRLLQARPPALPVAAATTDGRPQAGLVAAGHWYAGLRLACPILSGSSCTLYSCRPIACREHMVKAAPRLCEGPHPEPGRLLRPPISVVEALGRLAAEVEGTDLEAVMLPLLPAWWAGNARRAERTWPAGELAGRFVAILQRLAADGANAAQREVEAA